MSEWEELVGADFAEHAFRRKSCGISRAVSVLGFHHHGNDYSTIPVQGDNPCMEEKIQRMNLFSIFFFTGHQSVLKRVKDLDSRRPSTLSKAVEQVTKLHKEKQKLKKKNDSVNHMDSNDDVDWGAELDPIQVISNGWT